jgi:putative transposase
VLFYEDLDYILKSKPVYKALPAQCAQQTLKLLGKAWKSFFNAMKEWRSNPSKFLGRPKPPNYKEKGGETIITFTNQQCTIFGGYLHFPPRMELKLDPIKTRLPDTTNLREVRIVPRGIGYVVEIVYEKEEIDLHLNKDKVASIDIGLTNIVTIVNNIGEKPIVVKGGVVKSINQFYNKQLARYRSALNKQGVFVDSKRIKKLHHDRNNKIKTEFHRISRKVVDYLMENDIGSLAIGYNDGWKQECKMRKDVKLLRGNRQPGVYLDGSCSMERGNRELRGIASGGTEEPRGGVFHRRVLFQARGVRESRRSIPGSTRDPA